MSKFTICKKSYGVVFLSRTKLLNIELYVFLMNKFVQLLDLLIYSYLTANLDSC